MKIALRKEALGYVAKGVVAAFMAIVVFFIYRIETVVIPLLQTVSTQSFVTATNALARAESDYFDQLQVASDESHVLLASAIYVGHGGQFSNVLTELRKRDDFSQAKAMRMTVMTQLQNYAAQVAAISAGGAGTTIATAAKSTSTNLATLLANREAARLPSDEMGLVQTAVNDLASAISNATTNPDNLQYLAEQAQGPISEIATMIDQDTTLLENTNYVTGLGEDQVVAMESVLHFLYDDRNVNSSQRFTAIMQWRSWRPTLVTKVSDIRAAFASVVKANDALAAKRTSFVGERSLRALVVEVGRALGNPAGSK